MEGVPITTEMVSEDSGAVNERQDVDDATAVDAAAALERQQPQLPIPEQRSSLREDQLKAIHEAEIKLRLDNEE